MPFTALSSVFESFARAAAPVVLTSLWQGLAVAGSLALCLKFAPRISAAHRFTLWAGAFAAILALPLVPQIFAHFESTAGSSTIAAPIATHAWLQFDTRWSMVLAALWLIASAARITDLVFHVLRLRSLWRTATPVEVQLPRQSERSFEVCCTQCLDRPSVIGFFAPRILIPDWLFGRLTPAEMDQIILHETEHLRRFDDWTNFFQKLCLVLFPLNPALWWVESRLSKEREMACDEGVIRITQAPRAYAACLANLAERGLEYRAEALSLGAWHRRSELVDRVHSILRNHRGLPPIAARVLLGAVSCSLLAATVELARCPQLVAFVPSAQAASTVQRAGSQSAQFGDAVYPSNQQQRLTPGVHAVLAEAEMPAAPPASRGRLQNLNGKAHPVGELRAASSEPRISESRSPSHEAHVEQPISPAEPQQWIVFTAWEKIETSNTAATQTTADYDTDPAAETPATSQDTSATAATASATTAPAKTDADNSSPIRRHTTVTRLIFRVLPPGSKSAQPTAIPIGDGWFVIQL
jgi:beta-lactamase regulating signal transducer with metallopeptidase domain